MSKQEIKEISFDLYTILMNFPEAEHDILQILVPLSIGYAITY